MDACDVFVGTCPGMIIEYAIKQYPKNGFLNPTTGISSIIEIGIIRCKLNEFSYLFKYYNSTLRKIYTFYSKLNNLIQIWGS